ncbi:MAG: Ig-like domain-containing protein [Limisphaerales bacterium]
MNLFAFAFRRNYLVNVLALLLSLMSLGRAHAQPTIVSTVPPTGASGVSLSAAVVITFSEAMNTNLTLAYLFDSSTLELLSASLSWSAGNTVLACTPTGGFPANQTIWWTVMNGQDPAGVPLSGYTGGSFTTGSGGQPTLANAIWSGGMFTFDVTSQAGQTLTVEYSSTLRSNQWQTLLTTNSPAGLVHIADPHSSTNPYLFYRPQTGS